MRQFPASRALIAATLALLLSLALALNGVQAQRGVNTGTTFLSQAEKSSSGTFQIKSPTEFDQIIATPRDYSVSMLLTAVDSPPINCLPCKTFAPTFEGVAKGYRKAAGGSKKKAPPHLFAVLEFKDAREIFQRMKVTYAPILYHYPATSGPNASPSGEPEQYDFNRKGFEGFDVADDISKRINFRIKFRKPFPWRMVGITAGVVLATTAFGFAVIPRLDVDALSIGSILGTACKAVVLATITIMCGGYMWNGIRGAPYMTVDSNGKPQYFAAGFQNQNGAETQIVAAVYAILAFSFTSLTILVPMQRDPVKQRAAVYLWSAILLAGFSLLFYIFRLKNPSYPFRLFF